MPTTNKDGANSTKGHVVSPSQGDQPKNVQGATANEGGRGAKNNTSNEKKKGADTRRSHGK